MKKVAFHTLGCKLNFSETSTIARLFKEEGYQNVPFDHPADIFVLNTCSVTDNADKECRYLIRQVNKKNPEALLCIIGCYAQLKSDEIASIPGVDLVLGAKEKFRITEYVKSLSKGDAAQIHSCEIESVDRFTGSFSLGDRTRAFLKVQDGCDYNCSYCTIPMARGISRSDSLSHILEQVEKIAEQGIREIVLTGVNIGDYGKGESGNKKHAHTFLELISALDKCSSVERLRISSIEPNLLSREIIEFVAGSRRFVPHFHIPLQSGSNTILGAMRRRYRAELYAERIALIKQFMPEACIGADVITGFPGEKEEHFLETYHFLQKLNLSYLHVFTFSERSGTPAIDMPDKIPVSEKNRRTKMLRILSAKMKEDFYRKHSGKTYPVLFEQENNKGFIYGFTPNYIRVKIPFHPEHINRSVPVELAQLDDENAFLGQLSLTGDLKVAGLH